MIKNSEKFIKFADCLIRILYKNTNLLSFSNFSRHIAHVVLNYATFTINLYSATQKTP